MMYLIVSIVVWLIIYFIINSIFARCMMDVAYQKGYYDRRSLHKFVLFFGIWGCLYIIALPDMKIQENWEKIITLLEEIKLANQQINFSKEILSAQDVSNELPDL